MEAFVRRVSFNGGVVAPYLDTRIDLAKYQTGLIESLNQIPCDWGGSQTRPGLVYDSRLNRFTVLVPYVVSASVSYLLLLSDGEMRIARDGVILPEIARDENDLPVDVIQTPYTEADLYELKVDSLIDRLWIAHPNHPPFRLSRISQENWDFRELPVINPPMIPRAGEDQLLTLAARTGQGVTLTSDADLFVPAHVGSYWRIGAETDGQSLELGLSASNGNTSTSPWFLVQGDWAFTTSGNWRGNIYIERTRDGGTTVEIARSFAGQSELRNIASSGTEADPAELRIRFESSNPGNVDAPAFNPQAAIEVSNTDIYGLVRVVGFTSATEVQVDVIQEVYTTDATALWEEGAWSAFRGYPAAVVVHERRLMFAATQAFPNRYWSSRQDDRQDFRLEDDDQSALAFDLPSRDVIQWMLAERQLIVGTRSEEVIVSSGRDDLPLSPENSIARIQGSIGSTRVQAIKNSNAILYAERRGRRVRELSGDEFGGEAYTNTDITSFAPHLFDAGVIQMAKGKLEQDLVFFLLSNRKLLCLNHNRDQQISSWFTIETKGDFESIAALPGSTTEDIVYCVTRREINGQTVRQLEHFAVDQWDLVEEGNAEDMVFADMARTFTFENPETVINGLEDWEGEELAILGDGAVQPRRTVENGSIELEFQARKVTIGLPYTSRMVPLWFEDLNTPTQGRKRKIAKVYFSAFKGGNTTLRATDEETFGALLDGQELLSFEVPRRNFADNLGKAPGLEVGFFQVSLESRHSRRQSVIFERTEPLPMIIQSMHLIYNVGQK